MRLLFATTSGAGHVGPLLPVARAAERAGHEILFAATPEAERHLARAGFRRRGVAAPAPDDLAEVWARLQAAPPHETMAGALRDMFARCYGAAALPGMLAAVGNWRPDMVIRESTEFASAVAADRFGVPHVRVGITLSTALEDSALALAAPGLDELRASVGLGPDPGAAALRRTLLLTQAPRAMEPAPAPEPAWARRFHDLQAAGPASWDEPCVYVSLGTEAPGEGWSFFPRLYRQLAHALADLDVPVLMTIGDRRDPAELGPLPPAVRVEQWVPQAAAMRHALAMVGHGGSGSTLGALAAGVPQAIVPLFADQPLNAERVAAIGAGIALADDPEHGPAGLAEAVHALLDDPRYTAAAGAVAAEIAALPGVDAIIAVLEEAAAGAQPVAA